MIDIPQKYSSSEKAKRKKQETLIMKGGSIELTSKKTKSRQK